MNPPTSTSLTTLVRRLVLGSVVFSLLYGEIRRRTGSIWPAVLMHWSGNVLANGLLLTTVTLNDGYGGVASFGIEGVMMMVLALAVTWALIAPPRRGAEPDEAEALELERSDRPAPPVRRP
ncbi:MAG: CPBP family intramembrane metalloprotease [Myxococcales bacterium FL481]|nr:MAG: CPBP family intramembrane metalloprotease [Myxococcales bacterium FL481]